MQCLFTSFLHKDDTIHNVLMFGEVGMLGGGIGVEGLPVYHVELLQGNTVSL